MTLKLICQFYCYGQHACIIYTSSSGLVQCDNCTSTDYNLILSCPLTIICIERIAHKEIHVVTAETCYIRHGYRSIDGDTRLCLCNAIMRIQPIHTVQRARGSTHVRPTRLDLTRCDSTWFDSALKQNLRRILSRGAEAPLWVYPTFIQSSLCSFCAIFANLFSYINLTHSVGQSSLLWWKLQCQV